MQRIGDEPADIVEPERRQHNLLDSCSSFADGLEGPHQGMRETDLVVTVGPDQQQVPDIRLANQPLQEFKRCRVQPLQVVEEQHKRVLGSCKRAEEPPEHHLEAVLRILRRQIGNGRLLPDEVLELGDEVDDQLTMRAERLRHAIGPLPSRSWRVSGGPRSGRPVPRSRTGCRVCTGRICRTRTARATERVPCGAR